MSESPERPGRAPIDLLERVFTQVVATSPQERASVLDELCPDKEFRSIVQELLSSDLSTDLLVDKKPFPASETLECGRRIGPYKLLEEIGQGGMGIVYMAEQVEPVRRKVAVKLVKPGVDTAQVLARFDAEKHALSVMDHPHIARAFDAGETEKGRPYFVMELVKGPSITDYCKRRNLSPRARLELFIPVCHAIQHAHQKGVIHRDLKPSNVLVTEYDGKPVAKVIDFGIAKAIHQPLTEMTMFTGFGQIVGTLDYMSPEQSRINQLDVDTRTDIYGLGVLLYELLTGTTPFDKDRLRSAEWEEVLRIIREEDPPVPSTRLSDTAREPVAESDTQTFEPDKVSRIVRGELDWIVMRALEKDRNRRYATPKEMADDLRRFLVGDDVAACPPTRAYRLRKFIQRNRAALATTVLVFVSLLVGLTGTTWQAMRASRAEAESQAKRERAEASERKAIHEAARATAISRYLRNDLLGLDGGTTLTSSTEQFDPDLTLSDLLERARGRLDQRFANQSAEKMQMQSLLMASYCSIGRYETAVEILEDILQKLKRERGLEAPAVLEGMTILATLHVQQANWVEAKRTFEETWILKSRVLGQTHAKTLSMLYNLANTCKLLGEYREAEEFYRKCYEARLQTEPSEHPLTVDARHGLAIVQAKLGKKEAEIALCQVLNERRSDQSPLPHLTRALNDLGECLLAQERFAEAKQLLEEALAHSAGDETGLDAGLTQQIRLNLSTALLGLEQLDRAGELSQESAAFFVQHPKYAQASVIEGMENHARMLIKNRQTAAAEKLLRSALSIIEEVGYFKQFKRRLLPVLTVSLQKQGKESEPVRLDEDCFAEQSQRPR